MICGRSRGRNAADSDDVDGIKVLEVESDLMEIRDQEVWQRRPARSRRPVGP